MTDLDKIVTAAEELIDAEIEDEMALRELEQAAEERAAAEAKKARAMKRRDEALTHLASLLGKQWPPLASG